VHLVLQLELDLIEQGQLRVLMLEQLFLSPWLSQKDCLATHGCV